MIPEEDRPHHVTKVVAYKKRENQSHQSNAERASDSFLTATTSIPEIA